MVKDHWLKVSVLQEQTRVVAVPDVVVNVRRPPAHVRRFLTKVGVAAAGSWSGVSDALRLDLAPFVNASAPGSTLTGTSHGLGNLEKCR